MAEWVRPPCRPLPPHHGWVRGTEAPERDCRLRCARSLFASRTLTNSYCVSGQGAPHPCQPRDQRHCSRPRDSMHPADGCAESSDAAGGPGQGSSGCRNGAIFLSSLTASDGHTTRMLATRVVMGPDAAQSKAFRDKRSIGHSRSLVCCRCRQVPTWCARRV